VHSTGERSGRERKPRRPPAANRDVRARVQFDASSFQQNFLDCNTQQNYWLHFHKVMPRETLSLFKTFEGLPIYRGPILSHFGFSSSLFQTAVPIWSSPRRFPFHALPSSVIFDSRHSNSGKKSASPFSLLIWLANASHKIFCYLLAPTGRAIFRALCAARVGRPESPCTRVTRVVLLGTHFRRFAQPLGRGPTGRTPHC
jgi:hypothetical protein